MIIWIIIILFTLLYFFPILQIINKIYKENTEKKKKKLSLQQILVTKEIEQEIEDELNEELEKRLQTK